MTMSKGTKEKSSSQKFWKKFGLGKSKSPTFQEFSVAPEPQKEDDDTVSVKGNRMSAILPRKRQSLASLKHRSSLILPSTEIPSLPSVLPRLPSAPTLHKEQSKPQPPHTKSRDQDTLSPHPIDREQGNPSHAELPKHSEQTPPSVKHVASVPPVILTEAYSLVCAEGIPKPMSQRTSLLDIQLTVSPLKEGVSSMAPTTALREDAKPKRSSQENPLALVEPNVTRLRERPRPRYNSNPTRPGIPVPVVAGSRLATLGQSTYSTRRLSANGDLLLPKTPATVSDVVPLPFLSKSSQRQPSATLSHGSSGMAESKLPKPLSSYLPKGAPPPTPPDKVADLSLQQLQDELEKERSVVRVLQGQKEAIAKDLDYFSMTVDELMEEKEQMIQSYEEEKLKSQAKEEDLAMLLEKVKVMTDSARDKAYAFDQLKATLERYQLQSEQDKRDLCIQLEDKHEAYVRLKADHGRAKDHILALESTIEQLIKAESATRYSSPWIHTPSASPDIRHALVAEGSELSSHLSSLYDPPTPLPGHTNHSLMSYQGSDTPASPYEEGEGGEREERTQSTLDDELMLLTKEKEKLQSDYSKIPLSGGGPMSRRRREELEEMLDEVDSQLSKVKQKIRRS
ncbi:hypothetical protein BDF14DRAFT_1806774 [Spinellus fusiger]|nr:hypothetical protein BDF14DRAFT_1806774 [Spinellus fusiger]